MKRGKDIRGLSTIVTTLLIIVLSLVAIGVVWTVVSGILSQGNSQTGLEQFSISLDIKNAYEESGKIIINVQRSIGEGELVKAKFILSDGTNSESITKNCTLDPLDLETFSLDLSQFVSTEVESVSIAPIFKSSDGGETIGDITDKYNLIFGETSNSENSNDESSTTCTPDCGLKICGAAPNECGGANACGTCLTGNCSEDGLSCIGCIPIVSCPTVTVCGSISNGCGGKLICGTCSTGTICQGGTCISVAILNEGIVEDVWPGNSGMYFGSSDLSTSTDYSGRYIKFLNSSETQCRLIAVYRFPVEGYEKSHIGFNFETSIAVGDAYKIFETSDECQAA